MTVGPPADRPFVAALFTGNAKRVSSVCFVGFNTHREHEAKLSASPQQSRLETFS